MVTGSDNLNKMVRAGQIIENRRGEFCLLEKLELITGTVSGHQDGFGFLRLAGHCGSKEEALKINPHRPSALGRVPRLTLNQVIAVLMKED